MSKKPVMLMILDGFGLSNNTRWKCSSSLANKPNYDKLFKEISTYKSKSKWTGCWTSRRTNGKFRSWSFKYWCRKNYISRT